MSNNYKYIIDFAANADKLNREIGGIKGSLKAIGTAAAAYFSVDAIVSFTRSSMAAYQESALAETALLTALKGRKSVQLELINQATELQGKTLFDDDETVRAQSLIAAFVKEEQQIKTLIPLIQDFATAKQMDLAGAADLVTKTFAGQMNVLGRYGIQVEGAAGSAERMKMITEGLNAAFGGQAEAAANASDGTAMLANNFENLKEQIGGAIAQSDWFNQLIGEMSKSVTILSSNLSFWQKINPFQSQEATYQKALAANKEQQKADIEAAKIAEMAAANTVEGKAATAKAAELAAAASAFESKEALRLSQSYGGLATRIGELIKNRNNLSAGDIKGISVINAEIIALQNKQKVLEELGKPTVKRENIESMTTMTTRGGENFQINPDGLNQAKTGLGGMNDFIQENISKVDAMQNSWQGYIEKMWEVADAHAYLQGGYTQLQLAALQFGESMMQTAMSAQNNLSNLGDTVKQAALDHIRAFIAEGVAGAVSKTLAFLPFPLNIVAASLAAVAATSLFNSVIPAFASGGIITGPTLGLMGEYPGAASNPEIIAPLSKLKSLIEPAGSAPVILNPSIDYTPEGFRVMLNRHEQRIYRRT